MNCRFLRYTYAIFLCFIGGIAPLIAQSVTDCSQLAPGTFVLCETFTDADFTNSPAWSGDDADFSVDAQQLRSAATSPSPVQLTTPVALSMADADLQWEFFARLRFNTSANNFADVYLSSNTNDLKGGNVSGYFVRIGGTPDEVSLWRKDGTAAPVMLIDGIDGLTVTTNNLLRIKVRRTAAGIWTLQRDFGLTGVYVTEGTATDVTYTAGTQFGFLVYYTSSNSTNFHFDDIYIGQPIIDTTPPTVTNVFTTSNSTVSVLFSEPLLPATAQNTANYLLNGSINPTMATPLSGSEVMLTFAEPFTSGQTYSLQISGVQDLSENTITTALFDFSYYTAQPADVLINEIFADPTPIVGLPDAEFVELYNPTNFAINLQGWGFTKTYPAIEFTLPAVSLPPGGYLILCTTAGAPLYQPIGQTLGILSSSTYLTNSGSTLTLVSPSGLVIDQVAYADSWYGSTQKKEGGWSLERINPDNPCPGGNNWTASIDPSGGTPGALNSVTGVLADTAPPQVGSFAVVNTNALEITFSEPVIGNELGNPANYLLSGGSGVQVVSVLEDLQAVTLLFNNNLTQGILYNLQIAQLQDCNGNTAANLQIQFGLGQPADSYDVLINEIYADVDIPTQYQNPNLTLPKVRFVELFNRTNKVIDLAQWEFRDAADTAYLSSYLLLPGAYVLLCSSTQANQLTALGIPTMGVSGFPTLNVTSDNLKLVNPAGLIIHEVNYEKSWYTDPIKAEGGYTLELIDPNNPCEGARNWRASNAPSGGTPGLQNSVYGSNPDTTLPDLLRAEVINPTTVQLFFTEILNRQSAADVTQYTISNGIGNPVAAFVPLTDFKTVALTLATPLAENTLYTLSVGTQVTDCAGNPVSALYRQALLGIAYPPQPNDLVINEILFNPQTGGSDYVELYNRTDKVISLNGWYIANTQTDAPDVLTTHTLLTTELYSLHPDSYVALTPNIDDVFMRYGNCGTMLQPNRFIKTALPTLPDDVGTAAITNLLSTVIIDRLDYSDKWHNEIIDKKDGISLERISPDAPTNSASNWQSAAATVCYGTPAYKNSQAAPIGITDQTFTIEPKAFSPDDDGFNDFTIISYQLPQSGYTGNITIYDERGREIRRLVQNEILGTQGFYKWNGMTDRAEKAPLGIYVVYFELFNLAGDVQKHKKTCIVGGRLEK